MRAGGARYYIVEDIRDSIESLQQLHGPDRRVVYWMLLAIIAVSIASLPLIKVDVSIGSPGQVRPAIERLAVIPAVDGIIRSVRVRDNQEIGKGDELLAVDSSVLEARLTQTHHEIQQNNAELADITTVVERLSHAPPDAKDAAEAQSRAFENADFVQSLSNGLQTTNYFRQVTVLLADVQRSFLAKSRATHELARNAALYRRNLISDLEYDQQKFAVKAIDREIELTVQQALSRWQADKRDHELKVNELQTELTQLETQKSLYTIRAPIAGTALGFEGLHPGQYLPAGQRIGEISPGQGLQADVFASPRDVGFIKIGQRVSLQIDAFPYTEWGTVKGKVRYISQDFVQIGQQVAFKVVVDLDQKQLHTAAGAVVNLRRGMTVNARFLLKRRTLFNLLYGKLSDALDPAATKAAE